MKLLILLAGVVAQMLGGLWFLDTPIVRTGLTEGDAITFTIPVEKLQSGTYVQFGVTLENLGDKAPRHYSVEVKEGRRWRNVSSQIIKDGISAYSFNTVAAKDAHPSTYMEVFKLRKTVKDSLSVRCRVCSPYAADRTRLDPEDPANAVSVKARSYVGARLVPLGRKAPAKRLSLLLVGNSFTYFYGEPLILQEIAFSQGLDLDIKASLKGGQTFRQHTRLQMSLNTCSSKVYDYAILQGQSQEPAKFSVDPTDNRDVKLALCEICDNIRGLSPDCKIMVENTWAYESGEFGGFGSMERFDSLLVDGTRKLATSARADINPVGQAYAAARAAGAPEGLYDTDAKHPGLAGAYLKACISYLKISGHRFKGDVPSCGLPEETAAALRSIAESIVIKK